MQIGNTKYTVSTTGWKDRTPGILKFGCDTLVFISLIISVIWPDVDIALKISVSLKLLSNFISEHIPQPIVTNSDINS